MEHVKIDLYLVISPSVKVVGVIGLYDRVPCEE